ncbi:MAG: adenine phosphoribosyltransferase [Acidobacteria bacterium]|nr:adenine phosphoribosyltransferase [Acidobacteriota bacterium]NIM63799.1 adenine phosphoribosyltransferase [Acidobacteriota bacterium]NIO58462.1 adenine phosphoribosyltransferase [Acidobacteriota bacterium]NIQ29525.1 adenine phosphoribosyltransferase [Acidobacteriota bacterium]NIQ84207.1 adenine phosphoribosyltransferase [Acidobacteriota bacterium]
MLVSELKKTIREIPDFPKPGVGYKDLTTLFRNPLAFVSAMDRMVDRYHGEKIDLVAGIDARGFSLASVLAYRLDLGLVLVRKAGKLPAAVEAESYQLEYGQATLEVHRDSVEPGQRVLVVDDLLATGGTAAAACRIFERLGAVVEGCGFLVELDYLNGRDQLPPDRVFSLIHFEE